MPATLIPPPITQSVYLPTNRRPSSSPSQGPLGARRPWYHRKQRNLEADLQLLLDAQAEGLTSGPDSSSYSAERSPSSSSSTPTLHSTQNIASNKSGKISLRDARKGLYMTMRRLALLKAEEMKDADARADVLTASFEQAQTWTDRRKKLVDRAQEIQGGTDAETAAELRDQASALQPEIEELEQRLLTLRNEQRKLRRLAEDVENRVQAKMSTYTRNLEALDRDVDEYLRDMQPPDASITLFSRDASDEEPFWSLPKKRRTLEMAREVLEREKKVAETKQDVIETEREALEEGAIVWKDAVRDVEDFEKALREEMRNLSPSRKSRSPGSTSPVQKLQDLLAKMADVAVQLESKLRLAESRGWKLLIAAVGAELDAFQQGRGVLEATLSAVKGGTNSPLFDGEEEGVKSVIHSPPPRHKDGGSEPDQKARSPDRAFVRRYPSARDQRENASLDDHDDDDDDGPDPELLISHEAD
ncbi:hypothetical protein ANO11243_064770 [Dothideomycetidae sp. 11243]|nr:hypothetical protein ANO11243_064770 [fungal sp. No.11243]